MAEGGPTNLTIRRDTNAALQQCSAQAKVQSVCQLACCTSTVTVSAPGLLGLAASRPKRPERADDQSAAMSGGW